MKKISTLAVAFLLMISLGFSQAKPKVSVKAKHQSTVILKKDGTPDKRYTAAKAKPALVLKKDGTPDKRYKAASAKKP